MRTFSRASVLALALLALAAAIAACSGGGGGGGGGGGADDDDDDVTGDDDDDGTVVVPITVTATMLTEQDVPVPGVKILLDGVVHVTDTAGQIVVADVLPPYSIGWENPFGEDVRFYVGATRPDPVLRVRSGPFCIADAVGSMSPAAGSGMGTVRIDATGVTSAPGDISADTFSTNVIWYEAPTLDATLRAFRWSDAGGGRKKVTEYGTLDVTFQPSTPLTGLDIPMAAVTTGTLLSTITVPDGYGFEQEAYFAGAANEPLFQLGIAGSAGAFVTATLPGADVVVEARSAHPTDYRLRGRLVRRGAATGTFSGAVPDGLTVLAPEDGATVSPGTVFQLEEIQDPSWYSLYAYTKGGITLLVYSSSATIAFPDIGPLDTALVESGHIFDATAVSGPQTIDDLLSGALPQIPAGVQRESRGSVSGTIDNP